MATSKADYYTALPVPYQPAQNYVVLAPYYPSTNRRRWRVILAVSLALLSAIVYIFWPSDPDVKIVRLHLRRIQIHTVPRVAVDISMFVTVRVRNTGVYSMDYNALDVAFGYRGKNLGHVTSEQGHVRARASSYVDAQLDFNGVRLLSDVVYLLEDLAKGTVPFDTVTEIKGQLGLFFFEIPLSVKTPILLLSTCKLAGSSWG
ncbi:hypothetical protein CJ030_MR1G008439 [Morella rubra]|uniref:Late embryogenesis abundant protein LEA-2 subgroup domain-containing protein n=1 Tax=Morella rubra TaxID=262757 RepID=A0A6A1WN62_9ROSI|nr:hypothetical protein CJ030_MR1G008439 [Morella rubra]